MIIGASDGRAGEATVKDSRRVDRRGLRGGGSGMGGSACFVCSYRKATSTVSSRNGASRVAGRDLWRTLANFWGAMCVIAALSRSSGSGVCAIWW